MYVCIDRSKKRFLLFAHQTVDNMFGTFVIALYVKPVAVPLWKLADPTFKRRHIKFMVYVPIVLFE